VFDNFSDVALVIGLFAALAVNLAAILTIVARAARWIDARLEDRISKPVDGLREQVIRLDRKVDIGFGEVKTTTAEHDGDIKRHGRAIDFLKERTAGLESKVFSRPPILDDEEMG
jgi:hypothetical protein